MEIEILIKSLIERLKLCENEQEMIAGIKELNVLCTKGQINQTLIASEHETLKKIIKSNENQEVTIKAFQLLANICVQNSTAQKLVWDSCSDLIMLHLNSSNYKFVNVSAMILHNMLLSGTNSININLVLSSCIEQAFKLDPIPDFLHILLDHLICEKNIVECIEEKDQKNFLHYVFNHVQNDTAEVLEKSLVMHISMEFKKKSDCILKTISSYVDSIDPQVVVILLDIIATISSQEKYRNMLSEDRSLFLNMGCLLQAIHKMGKNSSNIFTPIQKLDALLPSSEDKVSIESEISYSFKTQLVRSLANLSHKNLKNQELAREMEIMQSIFDCTNVDARNPLIKEWGILAIRNLCENNLENQEIVHQLTRVGDAHNPVLNEFGIDDGIFRIKKN